MKSDAEVSGAALFEAYQSAKAAKEHGSTNGEAIALVGLSPERVQLGLIDKLFRNCRLGTVLHPAPLVRKTLIL